MDQTLRDAEQKMGKAVDFAKDEFAAIRTGRAHPAMFAKIQAEYYGTPTPIQQLASFQIPEARLVVISPYDKNSMSAIEKSIRDSDLGVNPANDGSVIRIALPELTQERRKEYVKLAKQKAEEARVSVRGVRRHAKETLDRLSRDGEAGEDDVARAEKHLDSLTRKYVEQVDVVLKHKEEEILEV
ncbi:ribosome recycling factor [Actinopolymorpha cephalotaxi]|uniref:ribosome recycling factor n=1 Tax=Actinopolymorpha cephalotaxi TaxID=504797 RepID=UPI00192D143E|nr:ribosome recycling factor [Actinopolymorpha cephalotaxi]